MPKVVQGPHRAIFTEYRGPTDHKPSRIIAKLAGSGKRITISWNYDLGVTENHDAAALGACKAMGWDKGELHGAIVAGGGYVYMLV